MHYLTSIRGKLFVDVGANLGVYCAKLQKSFERTIAIEADPDIFEELSKRCPINCKPINLAASNIEGYVDFYRTATVEEEASTGRKEHNLGIGTMFPPISQEWNRNYEKPSNVIKVRAAPLSRILANESEVDLVKVDVEGAEWLVLEGAEPIMGRIKGWLIELHQPSRKHELEVRMRGYGYERFEWLDPLHAVFHRTEADTQT